MNLKGDERYSVHEIKGVLGDRNEHLREKCLATRRSKIGYIMETLNCESSGMKFQQGISISFMGCMYRSSIVRNGYCDYLRSWNKNQHSYNPRTLRHRYQYIWAWIRNLASRRRRNEASTRFSRVSGSKWVGDSLRFQNLFVCSYFWRIYSWQN